MISHYDSFFLPSLPVNRFWFDMKQEVTEVKELNSVTSSEVQESLVHVWNGGANHG